MNRTHLDILVALVLIGVAALFLPFGAKAAEPETYVTVMVRSYHFKRPNEYNEANWGIGFERALNDRWRAAGGVYRNSERKDSLYGGVVYTPWSYGGLKTSLLLGAITGYNSTVVPAAFPILMYERAGWGVNLTIVPGAVVGLQLKYKLE